MIRTIEVKGHNCHIIENGEPKASLFWLLEADVRTAKGFAWILNRFFIMNKEVSTWNR